jgi:hypothetical protein
MDNMLVYKYYSILRDANSYDLEGLFDGNKSDIKSYILEILDIEAENEESIEAMRIFFIYIDEIKSKLNKHSFAIRCCALRRQFDDDGFRTYTECNTDCTNCIEAICHEIENDN